MNSDGSLRAPGFTLIELIVVMLILAILGFFLANLIRGPMQAFVQVQQRANLVQIAETALQRMTREIRLALPNSIRVDAGNAVEILRTLDGGRYRRQIGAGGDVLDFTATTDTFDYLGPLNNLSSIVFNAAASQPDCLNNTVDCLVIFNTGQTGADAYSSDNMAALTNATASQLAFTFAGSGGAANFPLESPRQRFFVVDKAVSFICDTGSGEINRYDGYTIAATQPSVGTPPVTPARLLVDQVAACSFSYNAGSENRAGLVTLSLTINDAGLGQQVTLLQQAHVSNQP